MSDYRGRGTGMPVTRQRPGGARGPAGGSGPPPCTEEARRTSSLRLGRPRDGPVANDELQAAASGNFKAPSTGKAPAAAASSMGCRSRAAVQGPALANLALAQEEAVLKTVTV